MDRKILAPPNSIRTFLSSPDCELTDTVVLLGNAPSALDVDLEWVNSKAYMIGCNRGLDLYSTNAMVFSDRQPYWQFVGRLPTYKGSLILSTTIFDKNINCRDELPAPPYHGKYLPITISTDGVHRIPTFKFENMFTSGPSIVIIMLQVAIAAGYKRVGLIGVDYDYSGESTHFWGKEKDLGAFAPSDHAQNRILQLFSIIRNEATLYGVDIANLSPKRGVVDKIFSPVEYKEWLT